MSTNHRLFFGKLALALPLSLALLAAANQAHARAWSAAPQDGKFSNSANWSDLSGNIWFFTPSTITDLENDLPTVPLIQELNYRNGNASYYIHGGTLALTSQIRNQMTVSQTIASALWLQGNINVINDAAGGDIWLTGTVVNYGGDRVLTNNLIGNTLYLNTLAVSENATLRSFTLSGSGRTVIGSVTGGGATFSAAGYGGFYNRQTGPLTITGGGAYTGDVTLGQSSRTILDYTAGDTPRLGLGGGALNFRANSTLTLSGGGAGAGETFSSLTLGWGKDQSGHTEILRNSGAAKITITGDIRRAAGTNIGENRSTLGIAGDSLVFAPNATTVSGGILPHFVTISGRDWAKVDTANNGALVAFSDYIAFDSAAATDHAIINGDAAFAGNKTVGTLKINTSAAGQTLNIGSNLNFTATSVSGASSGNAAGIYGSYNGTGMIFAGDHDYTITGGVLQTGWNTEFVLWTGGAGALTIASNITGNTITKAGAGTLLLSGSLTNINSGWFTINQGRVVIGSAAAAATFGNATLNLTGGALDLNGYNVTNTKGYMTPDNSTALNGFITGGTITNSAANLVEYTVGNAGSLGRLFNSTLFTGNLRLVLSYNSDTFARPYIANQHTGGTFIQNNEANPGKGELQVGNPLLFGTGTLFMAGRASFQAYDGDWSNFANGVNISGTNNYIMSGRDITSTGAWTGDGQLNYQASNNTLALTGNLSAFTGTLNLQAGWNVRNGDGGGTGTLKLSPGADFAGSLVLFDSATGAGKTSTLNLQATAAGTVKIGDLSTYSAREQSAQLSASGTATVSAAAGNVTFEVGAAGRDSTFAGNIVNGSGTVALAKVGDGTWTLTGTNTYTGATTVSGGVLLVNGSGRLNGTAGVSVIDSGTFDYVSTSALASAVTVSDGGVLLNRAATNLSGAVTLGADGILAGNGTANLNLTAAAGAHFAPGFGTGDIDTLTINSGLTLGNFVYDFDLASAASHDLLNFNNLTLNGSAYTLNVNPLSGFDADTNFDSVVILSGLTSDYTSLWSTTDSRFTLSVSNGNLLLNYTAQQIPEPSTWLLLSLGGATLLLTLRRKKII